MHRLVIRSVVGVFLVLLLASRASAAPIPIGYLQWDDAIGGNTGKFSIVNQSGVNATLDGSFPVLTQLLFSGMQLDLLLAGGGTASILQAAMTSPDGGLSFDTAAMPLAPYPQQASLTGSVSPLLNVQLDLDGNGPGGSTLWNLGGIITDVAGNPVVVLGDGQSNIDPGIVSVVYVQGDLAANAVPEPMTLALLGTGLAVVMFRRRRAARS